MSNDEGRTTNAGSAGDRESVIEDQNCKLLAAFSLKIPGSSAKTEPVPTLRLRGVAMATRVRRIGVSLEPHWKPCPPPPSVLLVLEDRDLQAVAARVLASAGFSVSVAAHSGHAVLASFRTVPFDVLVIEQRLSEGSSGVIAERLQRYNPGIRVIRLCDRGSASKRPTDLIRPFTGDDLIAAVDAVAQRSPSER